MSGSTLRMRMDAAQLLACIPSQHGLDFIVVAVNALMYFGNDGGIYRTLNGYTMLDSGTCGMANGFDNLNASSVAGGTIGSLTQFVSLSLAPDVTRTRCLAARREMDLPGTSAATENPQWTTVNGGDGGYSAISRMDAGEWYSGESVRKHLYVRVRDRVARPRNFR